MYLLQYANVWFLFYKYFPKVPHALQTAPRWEPLDRGNQPLQTNVILPDGLAGIEGPGRIRRHILPLPPASGRGSDLWMIGIGDPALLTNPKGYKSSYAKRKNNSQHSQLTGGNSSSYKTSAGRSFPCALLVKTLWTKGLSDPELHSFPLQYPGDKHLSMQRKPTPPQTEQKSIFASHLLRECLEH